AKKCKHCGETIDVTLRAAEEAKREAKVKNRERRREAPIYVTTSVTSSASAYAKATSGRSFSTCGCLFLLMIAGCAGLVMITALGTSKRNEKNTPTETPPAPSAQTSIATPEALGGPGASSASAEHSGNGKRYIF